MEEGEILFLDEVVEEDLLVLGIGQEDGVLFEELAELGDILGGSDGDPECL